MARNESNLVKSPYKKETMTPYEMEEFIKCQDPVTGPEYFMSNYFMIQHPTKGAMPYHPYEYQKRLIDTYHNYRFSVSMLPRQTGKSTSAAGYILWYAMFVPDSTILIAAHVHRGANEIMTRIRYGYENCPDFIRAGSTSYNKTSIEFDSGSRIISSATTENTGRGLSISLLYADEFAFVRPGIAKEFWTSMSPTLATGGKAIITSTPNSDEDMFANIWKNALKFAEPDGSTRPTEGNEIGVNGFKAFRAYWHEHPDRDEKWAEEQRAQLGEERFRREMDCEFIIYDETLISATKLIDLNPVEPAFRTAQVRWWKTPQSGRRYAVGLDPSLGTGGDPAAIQIVEVETGEQIGEWTNNRADIPTQIKVLADIVKHIYSYTKDENACYYSIENNTIGEAAIISVAQYGEENIPGYFLTETKHSSNSSRRFRRGFNTTAKTKLTACAKLKSLVEHNLLKINSAGLISELKTFVSVGTTYMAKPNETDDLVMAMILVVRMLVAMQEFMPDLEARIKDHSEMTTDVMPFIVSSNKYGNSGGNMGGWGMLGPIF